MQKYLLNKIKKNFYGYALIVIGYIVSIIVISLCISLTKNAIKLSIDNNCGKAEHQEILQLKSENEINYNKLTKLLEGNLSSVRVEIDDIEDHFNLNNTYPTQVFIIPFAYNKKPEWMPNQLKGRFFSARESVSNDKIAVIGNRLAEQYFPEGVTENSYIKLDGEDYKVIGIIGREELGVVDYGRNIYIPLETLPEKYKKDLKTVSINLLANGKSPSRLKINFTKQLKELDKDINISELKIEPDLSKIYLSVGTTLAVSFIVLFTAITNMANFSTWQVLKRKREISISKVLGASNKVLGKEIFIEAIVLSFVSSIIALVLQINLTPLIIKLLSAKFMINNINVSIYNWFIGIGVGIVISVLSSIISLKAVIRLNPAQEIKLE